MSEQQERISEEPDNDDVNGTTSGVANREIQNASRNIATMTITETGTATATDQEEIMPYTLRARPTVTWDDNVLDNEGLGRKSSKRCCIFHKQRSFGESSTDSSDDEDDGHHSDGSGSSSSSGGGFPGEKKKPKRRPIARPKKDKKVPNYQRFHA